MKKSKSIPKEYYSDGRYFTDAHGKRLKNGRNNLVEVFLACGGFASPYGQKFLSVDKNMHLHSYDGKPAMINKNNDKYFYHHGEPYIVKNESAIKESLGLEIIALNFKSQYKSVYYGDDEDGCTQYYERIGNDDTEPYEITLIRKGENHGHFQGLRYGEYRKYALHVRYNDNGTISDMRDCGRDPAPKKSMFNLIEQFDIAEIEKIKDNYYRWFWNGREVK